MTVTSIKVKVQRKAIVKLKVLPRFASDVTAASPILLDKTGGAFAFSFDATAITINGSQIVGTVPSDALPTPTPTTLGGVKSLAATSHQFLTSIGTDGTPTKAQPAFTDISGTALITQGGTGQITASAAFDALAPTTTRGDLIFRNATTNARLGAGTSGYHLQAAGAGADPAWAGFLQSGTGATTRTWNAKAADFVSVKDFGAVGNSTTDDTTAVQNAINSLASTNGGVVFFPPGTYKLTGGITVSTACRLVGSGRGNTVLTSGGADVTVITLNGGGASIEHMLVMGKGNTGDTFGATHPTINTGAGWVDGLIFDVEVLFGSSCITIGGSDSILMDVKALNGYAALCSNDSPGGCWFIRCKFDQSWPTITPPSGMASAIPAWASGTVYAANKIVTVSGFVLQCKTAGTSGGVAPTLKNYFLDIADGTVTWQLACPTNFSGMIITGTGQHALTMCDFTGCFVNGMVVAGAVQALQISQCSFAQHLSAGIATTAAGGAMNVTDCTIIGGIFTSIGSGMNIGATWAYGLEVHGNKFDGTFFSSQWGLVLSGGVNTVIAGNTFKGFVQAIEVVPNVSNFVISGNATVGCTNSIKVDAGTSDFYNIVNNLVGAAAVSDSGSGTNKSVTGNNSVVSIAQGGTGAITAAGARTNLGLTATAIAAAGQLPGTATNDSATAGNVGEYISSNVLVGSAVSLTTNTAANVTSISLTAGDWDVWGTVALSLGASTTMSFIAGWISTTSASFPTVPNNGAMVESSLTFSAGQPQAVPVGRTRISLSATTTVYLSTFVTFLTSTNAAFGFIGARRVR